MTTVSVYTPSHNSKFLDDAYHSLLDQTVEDWQWVVLLNQGAQWKCDDARVKVVKQHGLQGIGALKQEAVNLCDGEILVELDHDDMLTPTCIERCVETLDDHPDVGLVYSDFAQVAEDGGYMGDRWSEQYGWHYHEEKIMGRKVLVTHSLEPTPHNASYIWYEPNHVKAFRRDAYEAAGGYDVEREILDDQDLMCRMYQEADFLRIPECLYLQRVHAGNTQTLPDTNADIQTGTVALYDRHVESNALAWAEREGLDCLDLGAAHNHPERYLGVDMHEGPNVDLVGDVFTVLAGYENQTVGVIRAVDFLEHIADKIGLMNEIHRVLAHGGMFLSLTPSTDGRGAWQDPTHVSGWNENSWWYFSEAQYAVYVPEISARFQNSRLVTYFPSEWHEENKISYVCANMISLHVGARNGGAMLLPSEESDILASGGNDA